MAYKSITKSASVGFPTLMSLFLLILTALAMMVLIGPIQTTLEDLDFGKTTQNVDLALSKIPANEFYKKEAVYRTLETARVDFANQDANQNCRFEGEDVPVWYNQKYLDSMEEVISEDDSVTLDDIDCMPEFDENIEMSLSLYLEERLEEEIEEGTLLENSPTVQVYPKDETTYTVFATTFYREQTDKSFVSLDMDYQRDYEIGLFPELLQVLSTKVPQISDDLSIKVPQCVRDNLNEGIESIEVYCIEYSIEELIKKDTNQKLWDRYKIEVNYLDEQKEDEYYAFTIQIYDTILEQKELEFGVKLTDNIPFYMINFFVENSNFADNMITVKFEEPKFANEGISNYVVLYSYDNFFDPSYPHYENLKELLLNNKIPSQFEDTGFTYAGNKMYRSSEDDVHNLNLLLVSPENFKYNDDTQAKVKEVLVYQAYNFETKEFEPLQNKPLYAFVFAVDKRFNYYVEEVERQTKSATPQAMFGPTPLTFDSNPTTPDTVEFKTELSEMQNSLEINIFDYQDVNFNHFDLYVFDSRNNGEIVEKCAGAKYPCYYFDGSKSLTNRNVRILLTSDNSISQTFVQEQGYNALIKTDAFYPNQQLKLETNIEYEILAIPVDDNGRGIIKPTTKEYELQRTGIFYQPEKVSLILNPKVAKVTLSDNKKPDPQSTFGLLTSKLSVIDNTLYLQWQDNPSDLEEIVALDAQIDIYDQAGQLKYSLPHNTIQKDGKVMALDSSISRVVVSKLIPIDVGGNSYEYEELPQIQRDALRTAIYP